MSKILRRASTSRVPLKFTVVPEHIRFETLEGGDFDLTTDELFIGFMKVGGNKMHKSSFRKIEEGHDMSGNDVLITQFDNSDVLSIESTMYQSAGTFQEKKAEISVWLKQNHARKSKEILIGQITVELEKFADGKTQSLEAVFHHQSSSKNDKIVVKNAYIRIKLTANTASASSIEPRGGKAASDYKVSKDSKATTTKAKVSLEKGAIENLDSDIDGFNGPEYGDEPAASAYTRNTHKARSVVTEIENDAEDTACSLSNVLYFL